MMPLKIAKRRVTEAIRVDAVPTTGGCSPSIQTVRGPELLIAESNRIEYMEARAIPTTAAAKNRIALTSLLLDLGKPTSAT
jgi:hypothetical protein